MEIIYGTLKECVDKLFKRIEFDKSFPEFNIAVDVIENAPSIKEAYTTAEGWFGCKDIGNEFDSDIFELIIFHYGGGGLQSMEIEPYDIEEDLEDTKENFMKKIGESTDYCDYGVLKPSDYVIFEIK